MTPSKLIAARQRLEITQECMAECLGLTPRHLRRMERGECKITVSVRLATLLLIMVADDTHCRELAHLIEEDL